jgi:TonB dependent receptor/CarboxypepD_reg-like domain/TonB-dependent Receptor Plug Domain
MVKHLLILTICLVTNTVLAQTGRISGRVTDKNSSVVVIGATVIVEGTTLGGVSDTDGRFYIKDIPSGSYNIQVQSLGYEQAVIYNVVISSGNEQMLTVELDAAKATDLKEVVIRKNPFSHRAETPLSIQTLSAQEIKSNPGGNFDVSRVIQAFPGVGGTSGSVGGYRNDLIIRGGAPNENIYYLDGIEVPVINHFATQGSAGGPTGILNISFIDDVSLYTSAFPAKYDNALSGILQIKQREANHTKIQTNFRLSATELACSADGPISEKITFEASARRSYLQLLFRALQIPIQPSYWDFQYKINYQINKKLTLYTIAVGAIDNFSFLTPDNLTAENVYILHSNPLIKQRSYTNGYGLKKLIDKGSWNLTFSRNMLVNRQDKYLDNQNPSEATRTLKINSMEAENKIRFEVNKFPGRWSYSYGVMAQYDEYRNDFYGQVYGAVTDSIGNIVQPAIFSSSATAIGFWKYGAFGQVAGYFFDRKLSLSLGLRTDGNTFTTSGNDVSQQISPRFSASYSITGNLKFNASIGRYYKIPTYTLLGYRDSTGRYLNKNNKYISCDHFVAGFELLPMWQGARFTLEGFYKSYTNYPVSLVDGISLANKGGDFSVFGNEPVTSTGKGRSYGAEFQFQQKLTKNFFVILSYTHYKSEFMNAGGKYFPASWDNGDLLSFIGGYKFSRNIELGVKFRYQGGAPYSPFDMNASQANYVVSGRGVIDYNNFNTLRLSSFNSMDIRIDKKWNYRKWSLDIYMDITNAYGATQPATPSFTFKRTADNKSFETTDGKQLKADGSNGIPLILDNASKVVIPTIGFIVEF